MLIKMIHQFNWVDIAVIILFARICYIGLKRGFIAESFKLVGTTAAIYLSLHYYVALADLVKGRIAIEAMPIEFLDFLCFLFLALFAYLAFAGLRLGFDKFIKTEAVALLNKWGGLVLGIGRAFLLTGLLTYILVISSVNYLKVSVRQSYLGQRMFTVAPGLYGTLWNDIMSKFMTAEKYNNTVTEVQEDFKQ